MAQIDPQLWIAGRHVWIHQAKETTLMIGRIISHYRILEHLGGGGMGVVYKAEDLELRRPLALKFLPPALGSDPDAKDRFIHEAQAASGLDHPNICTIHEIGHTDEGQLFICMAYYDGETVKKKIERGPLKLEEALQITAQVAQGLSKAHDHRVIHRDIKPANVMVTSDGIAKIVDFGLARLSGLTRLTREGTTIGTMPYMSPEQAQGEETDHRTDIWSLGVMLYEMVAGRLPFKGEHDSALVYSILNTAPEPLTALRTGIPIELDHILEKALAKRPDERYQHADELMADIRRLQRESDRSLQPHTTAPSGNVRPVRRRRALLISAAALVLVVAALFIFKPFVSEEMLVSEPKPIAVISFLNQTGDKSFDYLQDAIPNLLITNLEQSKYLRVATWERLRDLLKQMGKKDVTVIDRDLGFELCEKDGIDAIVLGSFVKAGNMFATDVKVLDVRSKRLLKSASARGEGVESILKSQIDELSRGISQGVGLSERATDSTPLQIAEYTTTSMEAYNYYLRAREERDRLYFNDAKKFLERAVSLDTAFAMAYLSLGMTENALGNTADARRAFEKARLHGERATIKERMKIDGIYAAAVELNAEKAGGIVKEIIRLYPKEKDAYVFLSIYHERQGNEDLAIQNLKKALELDPGYASALNSLGYSYAQAGRYDEAIACFTKYASLQPGYANPFDSMGEIYFRMGRLDDAAAKYREALDVRPDFFSSGAGLAYVSVLKGDYGAAGRSIDKMIGLAQLPGVMTELYCQRAMVDHMKGALRQAILDLRSAETYADTAGNTAMKAGCAWFVGWLLFERGDYTACMSSFKRYRDVRMWADTVLRPVAALRYSLATGMVDAQRGRIDSARSQLAVARSLLPRIDPQGVASAEYGCALLHAEILIAQDSAEQAIAVCRQMKTLPIPNLATLSYVYYNLPAIRDALARAYLQRGRVDEAITEYERLSVFDPSGADRRLLHPIYCYRLAMLYEKKGMREKALSEYRRFLELWKEADKDRVEVADAKKRLARLTR